MRYDLLSVQKCWEYIGGFSALFTRSLVLRGNDITRQREPYESVDWANIFKILIG